MRNVFALLLLVATGCGGNLSEEQRQKFREGMEQHKIVRITEPEIMTASLEKGQRIIAVLEKKTLSPSFIDSVGLAQGVNIRWIVPGGSNALAVEQELIDAYISGMTTGAAEENLQKIYTSQSKSEFDTLLYTKPSIKKLPDGSEFLEGVWNIYIPKKDVVLAISKRK